MEVAQQVPTSAPAAPAAMSQDQAFDALADNIFGVLNMPEPGQERANERPRDEGGRFAKAQDDDAEPAESEAPAAEGEANAAEPDEAEKADPSEDVIELPAEKEGDQPIRMPVSELIAKAKQAEAIEKELHELKNQPLVTPEVFDRATLKAVEVMQQYDRRLQQWMASNEPQPPHPAYGDPNSQHYDPDRYAREMTSYRERMQHYGAVTEEQQRVAAEMRQRQEVLRLAEVNRSRAVVQEFWPEIKDQKVAQKVQAELIQHFGKYGVTPEMIEEVTHPAFYALAKYALKGLQSEAVKEQAAKVVQAKPKLIKGQARQPVNPNKTRDDLFKRFEKSRNQDDALAIAAQLLG